MITAGIRVPPIGTAIGKIKISKNYQFIFTSIETLYILKIHFMFFQVS